MERHRAQLADAAIEEQLEVQTAFREHGARLQVTTSSSLVACSFAYCLNLSKWILLTASNHSTLLAPCLLAGW